MTEAAKGVDHITDVTPIRYRRKLSLHVSEFLSSVHSLAAISEFHLSKPFFTPQKG